eukprot:SAG25_NODE_2389_length_1660_cov_0.877643_2_plen_64_part_00
MRELLPRSRHVITTKLSTPATTKLPPMSTAAELCLDVGLLALQRRQAVLQHISFVCRKWSGAC